MIDLKIYRNSRIYDYAAVLFGKYLDDQKREIASCIAMTLLVVTRCDDPYS